MFLQVPRTGNNVLGEISYEYNDAGDGVERI
jgi:hypothetical protein